jgi:hypothetical protein
MKTADRQSCVAASDQRNSLKDAISGGTPGAAGTTSAPAKPMLAQMAQKSSPSRLGSF